MHKLRDAPGDIEKDLRTQIDAFSGEGKVYVLGLGNTDRSDDGAGILVAEELKKHFPAYSYSEHDGVEGTVLDLSEKNEDSTIFFVDAADMGTKPGTIKMIRKQEIRDSEITTHRVAVALMASMLERTGKKSAVVCIQPKSIEFRGKVSDPVASAIAKVVKAFSHVIKSRG